MLESRRAGNQVVVVVSAMGDTTDELLAMANGITPNPNPRELDLLLTAGERIAMSLLAIAINDAGVPAASYTGSQAGIITDTSHGQAKIIDIRPGRIEEALGRGNVVIVAGFQGVSTEQDVTTLGRGGSDTTAVALAGALGAQVCEIYTDVDGVYTADPRVVTGARKLAAVSLRGDARAGGGAAPRSSSYDRSSTLAVTACGSTSAPRSPTSPGRGWSRRTNGWSRP